LIKQYGLGAMIKILDAGCGIAEHSRFTRAEVGAYFDQMIADIRNPRRYAAWMVPVVSGQVPQAR
jgi:hypothetical protein